MAPGTPDLRMGIPGRRRFIKQLAAAAGAIAGLLLVPCSKSWAGYGPCSVYGCNCQAYMGSGDTCGNCGHAYSLHW